MNTTPDFPAMESLVKPFRFASSPYEYKVTALRECPQSATGALNRNGRDPSNSPAGRPKRFLLSRSE